MSKIRNWIVCIIGVFLLFFGVAPILIGRFFFASAFLAGFSVLLFIAVYMSSNGRDMSKRSRLIKNLLWIVSYTGLLLIVIFSSIMAFGPSYYQAGKANGRTVVVLGCKVNGESPSEMLQFRLDKALEILRVSPQSKCVVSGGQGPDEQVTEAAVMKQYLIKHGIEESRIFEEEQSFNTKQNIVNSLAIIQQNDLNEASVLVSSEFHVYRAEYYARKAGMDVVSAGAGTRWELFLSSWIREIPAIMKAYILE